MVSIPQSVKNNSDFCNKNANTKQRENYGDCAAIKQYMGIFRREERKHMQDFQEDEKKNHDRIMLVEDDTTITHVLKRQLERWGYEVFDTVDV